MLYQSSFIISNGFFRLYVFTLHTLSILLASNYGMLAQQKPKLHAVTAAAYQILIKSSSTITLSLTLLKNLRIYKQLCILLASLDLHHWYYLLQQTYTITQVFTSLRIYNQSEVWCLDQFTTFTLLIKRMKSCISKYS